MYNSMSMSRDRNAKEREWLRQQAREQREHQVASGQRERESQPVMFGVVPRRTHQDLEQRAQPDNLVERVLGTYKDFTRCGPPKLSMVGVDQQPPTPKPTADLPAHPSHPPSPSQPKSSSSSNSNKSQRPAPPQPSTVKPPHLPSTHAHPKNGEVKGSIKSGPGPGPGPGEGGGGRRAGQGKAQAPPPLGAVDPKIQQIMSEMTLTHPPMSALITTPRPHAQSVFNYPLPNTHQRPHHQRPGKAAEVSRNKQSKAFEGSQVNVDLVLSEDSEDEEGRSDSVSSGGRSGRQMSFDSSAPIHPPSLGPTPAPIAPLSPLSPSPKTLPSPKSSDDSSSSEESSDDSEQSSDHSSEDEQPESSPKHQENKSNTWKLTNFIPKQKNNSPLSQVGGGSTGPRTEDPPATQDAINARDKREQQVVKPQAGSRSGQESRARVRDKAGAYDESSDEGEPHHPPTPRVSAAVRETTRPTRDSDTRQRPLKSRQPTVQSSDSDSDCDPAPRKPRSVQPSGPPVAGKGATQILDKSPKVTPPQLSRESPKKTPKKRADTKRDSHLATKSEGGSGRSRKPQQTKQTVSSSSDSEHLIDVVNTTPEKPAARVTASSHSTPTRTPREALRGVTSPQKSVQASPRFSPKGSALGKTGVKRSRSDLSDSGSDDEAPLSRRSQGHSQKSDVAKDKGALVSRAFGSLTKKDKSVRERDSTETKNKGRSISDHSSRKASSTSRERSEKSGVRDRSRGTSESSSVDGRLGGSVASTVVNNKCRSPVSSAEPKVPIPQIQYQDGVPRLTCTIPISFIDKVPKPSVINGASSLLCKTEVNEDNEYKKKVLDNRTRGGGGKGKRKTCDPGTKVSEDPSKRKIISSIFGGKRQDHESDDDKVKKEIKKEVAESDDERCERTTSKPTLPIKEEVREEPDEKPRIRGGGGGSSTRQRQVSASPVSSLSDTSASRHHRKKKKQDHSPSSRDRKRPKSHSERDVGECESGSEGRRVPRGGSEDRANMSRKRPHDRESSLESTRSQPRSDDKQRSTKRAKLSHSPAAVPPPPAPPQANPTPRSEQEDGWDKDEPRPIKHSQRSTHSHQSSQYSQKGYSGDGREEGGATLESEGGEEEEEEEAAAGGGSTRSANTRLYGKDKCDESGTTPGAESTGYGSHPASEHESRAGGGEPCQSATQGSEAGSGMGAPPRQATANSAASAAATLPTSRSPTEQAILPGHYANLQERLYASYFERRMPEINRDYGQYLRMAKELKHIADGETDRSMQAMKYLEAALYFILSGQAMESDHDQNASLTMYRDTLNFIKWVSSVFRRENQESSINIKLAVLSLRCRSLLSLQIYKMLRNEHRENQSKLNVYFQNHSRTEGVEGGGGNGGGQQWSGGSSRATSSPSHLSQTPSPAGSVGSEGSQSSGYTTSTEGTRYRRNGIHHPPVGSTPPHPQPPQGAHTPAVPTVAVPVHIHSLMVRQHQIASHLASAHEMWMEADRYVFHKNVIQDFFIELDRHISPLTLHSHLYDLVCYVQYGLQRLKD